VAIEGGELVALIGTVVSTGLGATFGLARWLAAHFDKINAQAQEEKTQQRSDFLGALDKRDQKFTDALHRMEEGHMASVKAIEAECSRQRELDRRQREEDRTTVLRLMGLATTGDTGTFREKKPTRRKGSGEDARDTLREEEGAA
jgi:hypothetical protein